MRIQLTRGWRTAPTQIKTFAISKAPPLPQSIRAQGQSSCGWPEFIACCAHTALTRPHVWAVAGPDLSIQPNRESTTYDQLNRTKPMLNPFDSGSNTLFSESSAARLPWRRRVSRNLLQLSRLEQRPLGSPRVAGPLKTRARFHEFRRITLLATARAHAPGRL